MDNWKSSLAEKCLATYIDRKIKSEVNNFVLCKLHNYLENLIIIINKTKESYMQICKDNVSDIHKSESRTPRKAVGKK